MSTTNPGAAAQLNRAQVACLKKYANGDFEHLLDSPSPEAFAKSVGDCGDTLLTFLLTELSSSEDCDSVETALNRIERASYDLRDVTTALCELSLSDEPFCPQDTTAQLETQSP